VSVVLDFALVGHEYGSDIDPGGYQDWILSKNLKKDMFERFYLDARYLIKLNATAFLARCQHSGLQISITVAGVDRFDRPVMKYRQYCSLPAGYSAEGALERLCDHLLNPENRQVDASQGTVCLDSIVLDEAAQVERTLRSDVKVVVRSDNVAKVRTRFFQLAMRAGEGVLIQVLVAGVVGAEQLCAEEIIDEESFDRLVEENLIAKSAMIDNGVSVHGWNDAGDIVAEAPERREESASSSLPKKVGNGGELGQLMRSFDRDVLSVNTAGNDSLLLTEVSAPRATEGRRIGRIGSGDFVAYKEEMQDLLKVKALFRIGRREYISRQQEHRDTMECLGRAQAELSSHTIGEVSFVLHDRYFRLLLRFHLLYAKSEFSIVEEADRYELARMIKAQCTDRVELEIEGLAAFWRWLLPYGKIEPGFRTILKDFCVAFFSTLLGREIEGTS
jgi:hypothetical protein